MSRRWQQQEWPEWSPGQWPKKKGQPKGGVKGDGAKKTGGGMPVVRAYDVDASTSEPSSSGGSTQQDGVQDFLKELAKSIGPLPDQLKKLLPNTDRSELKEQQKRLNRLRTLRNRIEAKEKAICQDEQQWEKWLREIKDSIVKQRKQHEDTQERLAAELKALQKEEDDLKKGVEAETEEEKEEDLELEVMVDNMIKGDPPNGKDKIVKQEEAMKEMRQSMEEEYRSRYAQERAQLQAEMNQMMQHFLIAQGHPNVDVMNLETSEVEMKDPPPTTMPVIPILGEGMSTNPLETAKAALVPFGVARRARSQKPVSPYGRERTVQQEMEAAKDASLIEGQEKKDPQKGPDTGQ